MVKNRYDELTLHTEKKLRVILVYAYIDVQFTHSIRQPTSSVKIHYDRFTTTNTTCKPVVSMTAWLTDLSAEDDISKGFGRIFVLGRTMDRFLLAPSTGLPSDGGNTLQK